MWIIFRDPDSVFTHLDKYVVDVVEDDDIYTYQAKLAERLNGRMYEIHDVSFLQQFVTAGNDTDYFARKYNVWSPRD